MKTFLLAAGLLMTGASVYGIVDYNQKQASNELKELYKEKPAPVSTKTVVEDGIAPSPVSGLKEGSATVVYKKETTPAKGTVKKKKVVNKKKAEKERVFRLKEFSRGKLG